ncbi:MAG: hypothetical protein IIX52_03575 [Paludibacteraceae bacterium]|nr:hypothetical protein [Paludibacteraceae bacterium]
MIYLYAEKLTPRVQYTCTHVFGVMLNQEITWVNALNKLPLDASNPSIAYTAESCPKGVFKIVPHGLLFKKGVKQQTIQMSEWRGLKTFFSTAGGDVPFDMLAAIFYLITRYEEYVALPDNFDSLGRFKAEASLAYQEGFLQEPLVDKWVAELDKELSARFGQYEGITQRRFLFRPVVVIDSMFKYQNNAFVNNAYQFFGNLFKGRWTAIKTQIKAILRITEDPYCNFSSLLQLHNRNNVSPIFFLRVAYESWWRSPIYALSITYRKLLSHNYMFELHASPMAAKDLAKLLSERKKLYKITKSQVTMNCYHQLAFSLPQSYRNLLKTSFKEDYSMAYPNHNGFRASTCTPYKYYDLEKEDYYKLTLHPVAVHDEALRCLTCSREDMYKMIMSLAKEVRKVNGEFVSVFHNDVLSESGRWRHWLSMYESSIRTIASMEVK